MTGVLIRRGNWDTHTHRGRTPNGVEGRDRGNGPDAKGRVKNHTDTQQTARSQGRDMEPTLSKSPQRKTIPLTP